MYIYNYIFTCCNVTFCIVEYQQSPQTYLTPNTFFLVMTIIYINIQVFAPSPPPPH